MDGQNNYSPTPNSYNTTNQYVYQFTGQAFGNVPGSSIHTWSVPTSEILWSIKFLKTYQVDNFINSYNYSWTTNPPTFPAMANEDTCLAFPGINGKRLYCKY